MITEERHQLIVSELKQKGSVRVADLVEKFNISESTIRRDLVQLEALNYLKRVHGGAVPVQNKFVEKSFNDKSHQFVAQKDLIAQYAASLVDEGDSIYLDSGTTTYEMIKYLKGKEIVVVTNGLSHVESLIEYNIPCFVLASYLVEKSSKKQKRLLAMKLFRPFIVTVLINVLWEVMGFIRYMDLQPLTQKKQ